MNSGVSIDKVWANPFEMLGIDAAQFPWITYDPTLRRARAAYYIIRSGSGDGTYTHMYWAIEEALRPLLDLTSCHKSKPACGP